MSLRERVRLWRIIATSAPAPGKEMDLIKLGADLERVVPGAVDAVDAKIRAKQVGHLRVV